LQHWRKRKTVTKTTRREVVGVGTKITILVS
jgi:hypothetical protein